MVVDSGIALEDGPYGDGGTRWLRVQKTLKGGARGE